MTTKQLEQLCKVWQKRLRLQDWSIKVEFEDADGFDSPTQLGGTTTTLPWQDADINVKDGMSKEQTELTLVHELLHVKFSSIQFNEDSIQQLHLEQGIESVARTLMEAFK